MRRPTKWELELDPQEISETEQTNVAMMSAALTDWLRLMDPEYEKDPVKRCPRCTIINEGPSLHCPRCKKKWETPFGDPIEDVWDDDLLRYLR